MQVAHIPAACWQDNPADRAARNAKISARCMQAAVSAVALLMAAFFPGRPVRLSHHFRDQGRQRRDSQQTHCNHQHTGRRRQTPITKRRNCCATIRMAAVLPHLRMFPKGPSVASSRLSRYKLGVADSDDPGRRTNFQRDVERANLALGRGHVVQIFRHSQSPFTRQGVVVQRPLATIC